MVQIQRLLIPNFFLPMLESVVLAEVVVLVEAVALNPLLELVIQMEI